MNPATDAAHSDASGGVFLRPLHVHDAALINKWHNDPDLYQSLGGTFRYVSPCATEEWLRERMRYATTEVNLAICESPHGEHIGNAYLRSLDWIARHAELHIFIGEPARRRRGLGTIAIRKLLDHAFNDLRLQRIYLYVIASNEAARKVYERCGFIIEGKLRQHAMKRGQFEDVFVMGLLADEWQACGGPPLSATVGPI